MGQGLSVGLNHPYHHMKDELDLEVHKENAWSKNICKTLMVDYLLQ